MKHLATCQQLLERAERRIELLSGVDANGNPITQPFDEVEAEAWRKKATVRGQRRTSDAKPTTAQSRRATTTNMDERPRLF